MEFLLRRLRGILGTGAVWGVAGAVFGLVVGVVSGILGAPVLSEMYDWGFVLGVFGFVLGSGFATIFTLIEGRKTLGELSSPRAALWGAAFGLVFPWLLMATNNELPPTQWLRVLVGMGLFGVIGASMASGTVLMARRAAAELPGASSPGPGQSLGAGEHGPGQLDPPSAGVPEVD